MMRDDRTIQALSSDAVAAALLDLEEDRGGSVSPFALVNALLRHARLLVGLPVAAFVLVALLSLGGEQEYVAESQFLPKDGNPLQAQTGGVLAQLTNAMRTDGEGAPFYAALVTSTPLLDQVAESRFEVAVDGEVRRGSIADLYGLEPATPEQESQASQALLRPRVNSTVQAGTGFVIVETTAKWPELAEAINARVLEQINEFNIGRRQTEASAEREFIAERMVEAEARLGEAEAELQAFLESNLRYEESPRLRFEAARLERRVNHRLQVYTSLAQSYEQARIAEAKNTPAITLVKEPQTRGRGAADRPFYNGLFAALVALILSLGLVAVRTYFERQREKHPEDYSEFRRLVRAVVPGSRAGRPGPPDAPMEDPQVEPARETAATTRSPSSWEG